MASNKLTKIKIIPRIISFFTKGDLNNTPLESLKKVKIDSYLISLGLLSQHFGGQTTFGQTFWKRIHQLFVLLLEWVMLIKWLFCATMPDNYLSSAETGDFTTYLSGEAFNYQFILIFWSSIGAISCSLFWMARNHDKLNLLWLEPFELCKGTIRHQDIKMEMEEASYFWQRTLFTLWFTKTLSRILFVIFIGSYIYVLVYFCPRDHLQGLGSLWIGLTIIWLYYNTSIQFGVMAVFHLLSYYFIVKFGRLNEIVKELQLNHKIDLKTIHQRIGHYMTFHNSYAKELTIYNKFWQYYLAFDFVIYITIICFLIELLLFCKMNLLVQILSLTTILLFFLFLFFLAFSASAVSDEIHESYGELNTISKNNMPLVLKTQLQIYIQRIGGPTIGFSCWDLFTITYDGFFQALLMIGSFFLLFMDVSQSEKKKRMPVPQMIDPTELT